MLVVLLPGERPLDAHPITTARTTHHGTTRTNDLPLLCSAFIATSLRFALQTKALAKLDANNAAMVFILEPVWTAILGAWFLSERMTNYQLLGCVLIFCAILVYRLPLLLKLLKIR